MIKFRRRFIFMVTLLTILLAEVNLKPASASAAVFTVNSTADAVDARGQDDELFTEERLLSLVTGPVSSAAAMLAVKRNPVFSI